jgi:hypothetical protein
MQPTKVYRECFDIHGTGANIYEGDKLRNFVKMVESIPVHLFVFIIKYLQIRDQIPLLFFFYFFLIFDYSTSIVFILTNKTRYFCLYYEVL